MGDGSRSGVVYLRELHMAGFKSFAHTIRLEFAPGVTAVVGPNGSGKSNIVDAVRWVLGEQSARALRGGRSEDVIFGGSTLRHPLGMAEVTLVLDNGEDGMGLDGAEIAIGRRLYRSGETEYLLNRRRARLRDVLDLAGQAGLGPDSYCVIGQGTIEQLVMQRPQERRSLIADAADIRRHEARLAEIETDLGQTQAHGLRLAAVVAEIRPQLERLRTQAERADRHRRLRDEVERLAGASYARAMPAARKTLEVAERRRLELQAAIAELRSQLSAVERRRGELQEVGAGLWARGQAIARELTSARSSREALGVQRAAVGEKGRSLAGRLADLGAQILDVSAEATRAEEALARSRAAAEEASAELRSLELPNEAELSAANAGVDAARRLQKQAQGQLDALHAQLQQVEREEARARGTSTAAEAAGPLRASRRLRSEARAAELQTLIVQAEGRLATAQSRMTDQYGETRENHQRALEALRLAEDSLNDARRALDRLLGEEQALAGLFETHPSARGPTPGAADRLINRLPAPPRYRRAILAALGEAAWFRVVDSVDTAWAVDPPESQELAEPILTPSHRQEPARLQTFRAWVDSTLRRQVGYRFAVDVLETSADLGLAARYLGSTIIVHTLSDARAAAALLKDAQEMPSSPPHLFRVATEDGQCLRSEGERVLRPLRREADLHERLEAARSTVGEAEAQWVLARQGESGARQALLVVEEQRRSAAAEVRQLEDTLRALRANLRREEQRLRQLPLFADRGPQKAILEEMATRRAAVTEEMDAAIQLLRLRSDEVLRAEEERRVAAERHAALAAQRAMAAQRCTHLQETLERDAREVARLADREGVLRAEVARVESEASALAAQMESLDGRLRQVEQTLSRLERQAVDHDAAMAAHHAGVEALATEHDAAQSQLADLRAAEAAAEADMERARGTLNRLEVELSALAEALGTDSAAVLRAGQGSPELGRLGGPTLQQRLARGQRELRGLGAVDYGVLADYSALKDRHEYLTHQLEDLAQTEAMIRDGMAEARERIQTQFVSAFGEVNQRFTDSFRELFGGGHAELLLSGDPQTPQCGIEIVAQPPGKRLHHLATLSGGERALTGAALLLALIAANPSPFCMLDEVDAALDESNVQRFVAVVREMARRTQFILVTHNRATMEAADALYGVTMTPAAVSQVVAIRLGESPA